MDASEQFAQAIDRVEAIIATYRRLSPNGGTTGHQKVILREIGRAVEDGMRGYRSKDLTK